MVSSAIFLPHQLTVGASGAAMGMLGCQWANLIMNWGVLVEPARQVPVLMLTVATEVRAPPAHVRLPSSSSTGLAGMCPHAQPGHPTCGATHHRSLTHERLLARFRLVVICKRV